MWCLQAPATQPQFQSAAVERIFSRVFPYRAQRLRGKSERSLPKSAHLGISANVAGGKDLSTTGLSRPKPLLSLAVEAPQVLTARKGMANEAPPGHAAKHLASHVAHTWLM